ncbi:Monooxygenase [Pleurostoma richardsiae]|uniref:Monooxygenase n=1 Tax=Pleurostoma richardsiae TaxID=41990 RepID=A0AA38VLU9_9PEZI|nr:Monooxygenase [Pleurostoma richardsiae]
MAVKPTETSSPSVMDLRIAIIGAGMGGLATALALARKGFKDIQVYEMASNLGFVGAGIQLAPNLVRILSRLGCWDSIEAEATDVLEASIRDGATNEELTHVHMPDIRKRYGFPHCTGHRASLAGGLFDACEKEPAITFHFSNSFEQIDQYLPTVKFTVQPREGEPRQVECDVLLGADGVKSKVRADILGEKGLPAVVEDTGQAAYRIMIPREKMASDPEMLALIESNQVTRWIGEKRHWIAYPVSGKTIYNMSSTQPDLHFAAAPSATYTTRGSKQAMFDVFSDFCPLVHRLMDQVPDGEVCEWRLRVHKPLPTWVHETVALVGDACHPTLPHLNQGAAMAIEDAAALAEVLARAPDTANDTVNRCLRIYEFLRKKRTTTLVDLAAASGRTLHLGESKAKEERDRLFAEAKATGKNVPDKWASPEVQQMIYSHDCMKLAADMFDGLYECLP